MQGFISLFTTYLPYFFFVMIILVFVHEYGHYWVGRRFGIHAEVFSIGFGRELFGWTDRNGTRWKVAAVPLGGYVKFLGGDRGASSATPSAASLAPEERRRAFFAQPVHVRAAVVLGGPAANLLFAFVLLTGAFFFAGEPYSPSTIAVAADGPAARAGLRSGDVVVRLGDKKIDRFEDIQESQFLYWAKPMPVEFRRGTALLRGEIVPRFCERADRYGNTFRYGELGIDPLMQPVVGGFTANSPAELAGLRVGDLLLEIDGKPIDNFSRIHDMIDRHAGQPVPVKYERAGQQFDATIVPEGDVAVDCAGKQTTVGRLRIYPAGITKLRNHGVLGAMGASVRRVWIMTGMFYTSMAQIVTATRPIDELGGPIRVAKVAGEASRAGWFGILNLVIALSVVIGVFNLLPVPMLDGGYLAEYAIEALRGKPLSVRVQEFGLGIGLAFVICMVVLATFNDIRLLLR